MNAFAPFLSVLALTLLCGCGGSGSGDAGPAQPSAATGLAYQDPAATGFRLVKNAGASTATRLVLDLVGPSGTQTKGVAFFLTADATKVTWVNPTGAAGTVVAPGAVLPLGSAPQLAADRVAGGQLQVGLFQKAGAATTLGDAPLLSLALELNGTGVAKGPVDLAPSSGKAAVLLNPDDSLGPLAVGVGSLSAQ
jgi:hypothetical protein